MDAESRKRFVSEALAVAASVWGSRRTSYSEEEFALVVEDDEGRQVLIYLANAFAEAGDASEQKRLGVLTRLVTASLPSTSALQTWGWAQSRLRIVLRPATLGIGQSEIEPPLGRPALPHLRELVVVDMPDSLTYVTPGLVEHWGVTAEKVFEAARANLVGLANQMLNDVTPLTTMARMSDPGDKYLTSLLLVPGWLASISKTARGPVVAFVPDAYTLVLCRLDAVSVPAVYRSIEEEYSSSPRALSPVGYVAVGDSVAPYGLQPGAPYADHVAATRAAAILDQDEYTAQAQWLAESSDGPTPGAFVARLTVIAQPDQPAFTVTVWGDGIDTLLPRSHYIMFNDGDDSWLVPWEAVQDRLALTAEPDTDPQRFRVRRWPALNVLAELFAQSLKL